MENFRLGSDAGRGLGIVSPWWRKTPLGQEKSNGDFARMGSSVLGHRVAAVMTFVISRNGRKSYLGLCFPHKGIFYRGRMQVFIHLDFPRPQELQVPTGNQVLCPRHLQVSSFVPWSKYHVGWIQLQHTCWGTLYMHCFSKAWESRKCFSCSVLVRIISSVQWKNLSFRVHVLFVALLHH